MCQKLDHRGGGQAGGDDGSGDSVVDGGGKAVGEDGNADCDEDGAEAGAAGAMGDADVALAMDEDDDVCEGDELVPPMTICVEHKEISGFEKGETKLSHQC